MSKKVSHIFKGLIKTEKYSYKIKITSSQKIENNEIIVYSRYFNFGIYEDDKKESKTCVDIRVMYPESQKELPYFNYKIANLITTHYNEKCSVNEKLGRGDGTKHMLHTAMYLVTKMCPFIIGFEINDASTRDCDNNTVITLSYFSITQYHKTWYEKNFDAIIMDSVKMKEYKKTVSDIMERQLPSWDTFKAMFLDKVKGDICSKLEEVFRISKTYSELFRHINSFGISNACILLQPWIDKLMLMTTLRNYVLFTQWMIPISSVKRIPLLNYQKDFVGIF